MTQEQSKIVRVMGQVHGRDISLLEETFVAKSIAGRLSATGIDAIQAYSEYLAENSAEADTLGRALNNSYSEFFRNQLVFALLEQQVLPELILKKERAGRSEIRIWSTACARGQEAYSIAMLMDSLAAARGRAIAYRIFATDHCSANVKAAQNGVYDYAAVRNVRLQFIREYFTESNSSYLIVPALKSRVDFSIYDFLDEHTSTPPQSIYGDFDLVICSNVLFYYRADVRHRTLARLWSGLTSIGYLVTGEAEVGIVAGHPGFRTAFPACAIFQKTDQEGAHEVENVTIRTQLTVGLGIILALVIVIGVMAWLQSESLWRETEGMYRHPLAVRSALGKIRTAVAATRQGMSDALLAKGEEGFQEIAASVAANQDMAEAQIPILRDRYLGPAERRRRRSRRTRTLEVR